MSNAQIHDVDKKQIFLMSKRIVHIRSNYCASSNRRSRQVTCLPLGTEIWSSTETIFADLVLSLVYVCYTLGQWPYWSWSAKFYRFCVSGRCLCIYNGVRYICWSGWTLRIVSFTGTRGWKVKDKVKFPRHSVWLLNIPFGSWTSRRVKR
jgi:uncharacterized membrane protein